MAWGLLLGRRKYDAIDYFCAGTVTFGCALFVLTGSIAAPQQLRAAHAVAALSATEAAGVGAGEARPFASALHGAAEGGVGSWLAYGLLLLGAFLLFDGLTSTTQDRLFAQYEMHSCNQLLWVSVWSAAVRWAPGAGPRMPGAGRLCLACSSRRQAAARAAGAARSGLACCPLPRVRHSLPASPCPLPAALRCWWRAGSWCRRWSLWRGTPRRCCTSWGCRWCPPRYSSSSSTPSSSTAHSTLPSSSASSCPLSSPASSSHMTSPPASGGLGGRPAAAGACRCGWPPCRRPAAAGAGCPGAARRQPERRCQAGRLAGRRVRAWQLRRPTPSQGNAWSLAPIVACAPSVDNVDGAGLGRCW